MALLKPTTVAGIIKPLQKALAGLDSVATFQDIISEKAGERLSKAKQSHDVVVTRAGAALKESTATETNAIQAAQTEAAQARKMAAKLTDFLA